MFKGKRVIWFNHWFSQAYNFIELLHRDGRNHVIASAKTELFAFGAMADERYTEPVSISGEEYVGWCLEFCEEHGVDVFFPKRFRQEIGAHMAEFGGLGVHIVMDGNTEQNRMLDSKYESCRYMEEHALCAVPYMERITDAEGFEAAYRAVKERYGKSHKVCIKADRDEGGITYRRLYDEDAPRTSSGEISYTSFLEDLKSRGKAVPTVVMPYLDEPEISIDCMRTESGLIAVPRCKLDAHITQLMFDEELLRTAERISENVRIEYPYNIQLRPLCGENVFMEINTRMAGGCYKAAVLGCNFPQLAVSYALGDRIDTERIRSGFHNVLVGEVAAAVVVQPAISNNIVHFNAG
ncbi:MAG: ATP-grasp domain-containing protein [Ruminococcus sp.]|nr:ATP-grasp domain-containing protein [Ruminococcus sp.]